MAEGSNNGAEAHFCSGDANAGLLPADTQFGHMAARSFGVYHYKFNTFRRYIQRGSMFGWGPLGTIRVGLICVCDQ